MKDAVKGGPRSKKVERGSSPPDRKGLPHQRERRRDRRLDGMGGKKKVEYHHRITATQIMGGTEIQRTSRGDS